MRIILSSLLIGIVFFGCGEDNIDKEQPEINHTEIVDDTPHRVITWEKDSAVMVLIPAGSFEMGDHFDEGEPDELPVHRVELDAFYMDRHEVTIGQYKQFLSETDYGTLPEQTPNWMQEKMDPQANKRGGPMVDFTTPTDYHPVVGVTFNDAQAYAQWSGKRLPTEAEWEYAARGGLVRKRYAWGNDPSNGTVCNFADFFDREQFENDGYIYTAPVGSYQANDYSLYDMAGNVWEWCADWYGENYYTSSELKNPKGPDTGTERMLRGGGWSSYHQNIRLSRRFKLSPTTSGFPKVAESSGLEKPILGQEPDPKNGEKPNPPQRPQPDPDDMPDRNMPNPFEKPVSDIYIGVGFRCVAELTIDQ